MYWNDKKKVINVNKLIEKTTMLWIWKHKRETVKSVEKSIVIEARNRKKSSKQTSANRNRNDKQDITAHNRNSELNDIRADTKVRT